MLLEYGTHPTSAQMVKDVPDPCPVVSQHFLIPEGVSPGDSFKFPWDGFDIPLTCPEGMAAGEDMEDTVPTEAHRTQIKLLVSVALSDPTTAAVEKKQKLDNDHAAPSVAPAPHLAASLPPDQGVGATSATPPAAPPAPYTALPALPAVPQLLPSAAPPLLQVLADGLAFLQSRLASGERPTDEQLLEFLVHLVQGLTPHVKVPSVVEELLTSGLASLGWDAMTNQPAPEARPPTPEAVLAFLEESLAKLGPPGGGAALRPLHFAGAAPM